MLSKTRGFPGDSDNEESACKAGDMGSWVSKILWRREWLSTPVFLPGESNGQRSLAGYSPWGCKESDAFERLMLTHSVTLLKPMSVFLTSIVHVSSTV